ncbi:MAG: glycosyltransferase family 2 protein [Egibacteraceae bacterium]
MKPPALDRIGDQLAAIPAGQLTEALTIPETTRRVSALVATYNRCPFDPATHPVGDNPLTWALDTLLAQAGDALREIVVVDDASTDHTPEVLARYASPETSVPVITARQGRHGSATLARNTAIAAATADLLLFGDDDCVFRPHYAAGRRTCSPGCGRPTPTPAA